MELSKIQVKIRRGRSIDWVHFCYVPSETKARFDASVNNPKQAPHYWVLRWALEDFGEVKLNTPEELDALKELIRFKYRDLYPTLFIESNTDNQGWVRAWYTEHMLEELKLIGK